MTDKIYPYPLKFDPIAMERIWGGTKLASLFTVPEPKNPKGEIGRYLTTLQAPTDEIC